MTSASDQENIDIKIPTFKGPAGKIFDSFQEQANYFLDTYWPNWKNYENPKSYIIPPTFKYKHAEVSDQNFEKFYEKQIVKVTRNPHEIIIDRQTDEAEFLVYNAIQQLIENGTAAPFIAIRNFNLKLNLDLKKNKLNGLLTEIFPNLNWDQFREILGKPSTEFDFLLIGPKIGIVVIEVKSSSYEKDFNERRKYLPEDYNKGLHQLESVNGLIYLLQECTGVQLPNDNCVNKILFTPNLEKWRYDNWKANLTLADQQFVDTKVSKIDQWFNEESTKLSFMLAQKYKVFAPISSEIYEEYAKILAAIASISINGLGFHAFNFSDYEMALKENEYLVQHNPRIDEKNKQIAAASLLQKTPKEVKKYSNVFFLTPDQQNALNGPPYQVIVGVAGTGKTIVLQAKACELLAKGDSVVVLATHGYMGRYKVLFDNYGFTNYTIYDFEYKTKQTNIQIGNYLFIPSKSLKIYDDFINLIDIFIEKEIKNPKSNLTVEFDCLALFDNILIDDAADGINTLDNYIPYLLVRYVQNVIKKNYCWAAIDPCNDDFIYNLLAIKDEQYHDGSKDIAIAILNQVLRCSEEIYKSVYIPTMVELEFPSKAMPVSGHKIQGSKVVKITKHFSTHAAALTELWAKIETEIELMISHGIGLKNIAIIVSNDDWDSEDVDCRVFLRNRCKQRWPDVVWGYDVLTGDFEMTSNTNLIVENDLLLITSCLNVSSLEWPVVISIKMLSTNRPKNTKVDCYCNYRAMSRATAKLIDITFTCDEPSRYYIEWSSSELDLLIDLFKKYSNVIKDTFHTAFYAMSADEQQAWENVCNELNCLVKNEPKRTHFEINLKIDVIFIECNNYAYFFEPSTKPKYFDIFNEIYGFVSNEDVPADQDGDKDGVHHGLFYRLINWCSSICSTKVTA